MAAKLLEVWRGDAGSRCAAAMRGWAGARGARACAGRQAGWPRGLRAAKMEDGGAEPRKHSSPPLPHPPFPARRGGEGGGERSASERARGRRKRPPCPPRPPSSSPEPTAGRPGPALGELKWRTAFSSSSSPLLLSRAGAAGKMEDSGIVCVGCVYGRAAPGRSGGRARGMGSGPEPRSGGALGRAQKMVGRLPVSRGRMSGEAAGRGLALLTALATDPFPLLPAAQQQSSPYSPLPTGSPPREVPRDWGLCP